MSSKSEGWLGRLSRMFGSTTKGVPMRVCFDSGSGTGCGAQNQVDARYCRQCGRFLLLKEGAIVGHLRIVRMIGCGAFGAVYEAVLREGDGAMGRWGDSQTRRVALKETVDPGQISSFQGEFRVLHGLQHPNLPRYLEVFEAKGNGYLVMEFVPGQSLLDVLMRQRAPLLEAQVLGYALQLCDVLSYLHRQTPPILHRDIKPANVRLTPEGLLKLVDFGLLKQGGGMTHSSRRGGTPEYAPLEQWDGSTLHSSPQSDIYSLGATLYHLLTNRLPLPAPERIATRTDPLASPSAYNAHLSPHVARAIMRALALRADERYADVLTFKRALMGALTDVVAEPLVEEEPEGREHLPPAEVPVREIEYPVLEWSSDQAISVMNAGQLTPVARFGKGIANQVAWSPEGSLLAVAASVGIYLYDTATWQESQLIESESIINDVAFAPDGRTLAAATNEKFVKVWEIANRTLLHTLVAHTGNVKSVAFAPNGRWLASSGSTSDKAVNLWDSTNGTLLHTFLAHENCVDSVAFSPDSRLLASASDDKTIKVWELSNYRLLHTLSGHTGFVKRVAFAPPREAGRQVLASAALDKSVKLWDATSGALLHTFSDHRSSVRSLAFAPDGHLLASAGDSKSIKLWHSSRRTLLHTLSGHRKKVISLAFAPDSRRLASVSSDDTIKVWDCSRRTLLHTIRGQTSVVHSIAFAPTGHLLASAYRDGSINLWDNRQNRLLHTFFGHTDYVRSIAFAPDGRLLASASDDKSIKLWDVSNQTLWHTFGGHGGWVMSVAFAPTGPLLASASLDGTIKVWDYSRRRLLYTLTDHANKVKKVAFAPDGRLLASAGDDKSIKLWDSSNGTLLHTFTDQNSKGLAFSPDGNLLASTSSHKIHLWDLPSRKLCQVLKQSGQVKNIAFAPDSRLLASASSNHTIQLWDSTKGLFLHTLTAHTRPVNDVAFSPDGTMLASGSEDGSVRLWR